MLNHVILQGRLTKAPELRQTQGGISYTTFTLAVDRDFKSNGQKEADFINCSAWRQTAEFLARYFGKGRMVLLEGRIEVRSYQDKEGNKRTAWSVVADRVYFGDSKPSDGANSITRDEPVIQDGLDGDLPEVDDDQTELPF